MLIYLLQSSGCLILFYMMYHLFLRKLTFFEFNRWYLIGSIFLSLLIPYLGPFLIMDKPEVLGSYYITPDILFVQASTVVQESSWFSFSMLLYALYFTGFSIKLLKLVIGLIKVNAIGKGADVVVENGLTIVYTNKPHLPFSFFNKIYISKEIPLKDNYAQIILHEKAHISRMHSLDILFLELVYSAFWFNPIFLFYKKALKQSYEYLADAIVTNEYDKNNYKQILLNHTVSGLQMELTNQFFNSQIKKRLEMINSKSSRKASLSRYLLLLPLILMLGVAFASNSLNDDPLLSESTHLTFDILNDSITVDQMPAFPGCGNLLTEDERRECTQEKLMSFLYSHIKYPNEEREKGITGKVVISFSIREDGLVTGMHMKNNLGGNLGQEVMQAVSKLTSSMGKWTPGKHNGLDISATYTVPVNFLLQDQFSKVDNINSLFTFSYCS